MPAKNFVVAIELGSTKITGIAGQRKSDGSIAVLSVMSEDASQCIRKGVVYNIDKTVQCITNIIQRLKGQLKSGIKHVYIGVGGQSIHSERNTIIRNIADNMPVTQQIIVDMMDQNRDMHYPDMEILDVELQEYRADSLPETDPVGIQCHKLEGNFLNILQSRRHYQKLNSCFDIAGVQIAEMYLAPFALADAVLTPVEKRSGCLLVDLGADTTTVMVYHKNIIRHIAVIPLGGANITKDITTLQVDEADAERLKLRYASAFTPAADVDPTLKYDLDNERKVESTKFIELIEGRMQEIISNVWNQVPAEFRDKILGGIVLTGGGSNMKNIDVAFREITHIDKIRIANFVTYTINTSNSDINAHDGTMNTLLGLLAKGDQNCWAPEESRTNTLFNDGDGTTGNQTSLFGNQANDGMQRTTPRDPNSLPQGVIQTAGEKKAAEEAEREAAVRRKAEADAQRIAEEERAKEQAKNKKPGIGNKILKWLGTFTDAEE